MKSVPEDMQVGRPSQCLLSPHNIWTCAQVLGRIVGMGDAAQDPADFPTSPALAAPKALASAALEQGAVEYWEVNEAFCVVDMVNQRLLGLDPARHGNLPVR